MNNMKKIEEIYNKYADDVYRLSLYLLKDENKAKEVTRQAFESIYKKLDEIDTDRIHSQLLIKAKRLAKNEETKEGKK